MNHAFYASLRWVRQVTSFPGEHLLTPPLIHQVIHRLFLVVSCVALGPLIVVEQTMKAVEYLNTIADQLHPYMASILQTGERIFQQEKEPISQGSNYAGMV